MKNCILISVILFQLIIKFARYGYQSSNYVDTNKGDTYINGIRLGYTTN